MGKFSTIAGPGKQADVRRGQLTVSGGLFLPQTLKALSSKTTKPNPRLEEARPAPSKIPWVVSNLYFQIEGGDFCLFHNQNSKDF